MASHSSYDTVYANQNICQWKVFTLALLEACEAATRHNRSNDSVVSVSQGKKRLQVNCKLIVQTAHFIFA